ncbi:MAG: hypothetical protein ACI9ZV_000107 [Candidatus Azotimanducaceae bacterium]|jgi:hypothetical protein
MTYRDLSDLRGGDPEVFYLTALRYGHSLWLSGHSGRAILAITRALYADVPQSATSLKQWPLPYQALRWIVANHPSEDFPGNPRISFQHQATRLRGERMQLRRARAWAVWALIRQAKPELQGDRAQGIREPDIGAVEAGLVSCGHTGESQLWQSAYALC